MSSNSSKGVQFERRVAKYFSRRGSKDVRITPRSRDGGIDILMWETDKRTGEKKRCGVECKNYDAATGIGRPHIQKFHSAIDINLKYRGSKVGYFVTSSYFTQDAREYVREINRRSYRLQIRLIDGEDLIRRENALGLRNYKTRSRNVHRENEPVYSGSHGVNSGFDPISVVMFIIFIIVVACALLHYLQIPIHLGDSASILI
jgi:restriction endonuclease Mrr